MNITATDLLALAQVIQEKLAASVAATNPEERKKLTMQALSLTKIFSVLIEDIVK